MLLTAWRSEENMKIAAVILVILLVLGIAVGGKLVSVRNQLVAQQESIRGAWAQVDVALQRRADLIPNLVETVKGFAKQEQAVVDSVTEARAALMGARTPQESIKANSMLDAALGRLLVVVENYPLIKSNENFLRLQGDLAEVEDTIQAARRYYNGSVREMNTRVDQFPGNLIARRFNFSKAEFFELDEADSAARQPVAVNFD